MKRHPHIIEYADLLAARVVLPETRQTLVRDNIFAGEFRFYRALDNDHRANAVLRCSDYGVDHAFERNKLLMLVTSADIDFAQPCSRQLRHTSVGAFGGGSPEPVGDTSGFETMQIRLRYRRIQIFPH
jgi:hypothetical protein